MSAGFAIALFGKAPIAGRTKSRLAMDIGAQAAADLAEAMLVDLLLEYTSLTDTAVYLFHPPDALPNDFSDCFDSCRKFAADFSLPELRVQQGETLGARLEHALEALLAVHPMAVLVGSDCVGVDAAVLARCRCALAEQLTVIQPADDGGYTLIGSTRTIPELFRAIDWGTESVFEQTRQAALTQGISLAELECGFDIDRSEDLKRLGALCRRLPRAACAQWLQHYGERL